MPESLRSGHSWWVYIDLATIGRFHEQTLPIEELETARETSDDPWQFSKIPPSHQMLVDWIADAWRDISCKGPAITKSFFVTGIGNVLGTWEETLIRSDDLQTAIDDMMAEVFGDTPSADNDPLASSDSENDPLKVLKEYTYHLIRNR